MARPNNFINADLDVNSLFNNREFQEILQEYFQGNTMTIEEFMEQLPRLMQENMEDSDSDSDSDEENDSSAFIARRNIDLVRNTNTQEYQDDSEVEMDSLDLQSQMLNRVLIQQLESSQNLLRSLMAGRQEETHRDIPLRPILPQSPPPSPMPNMVNTATSSIPFFQRSNGYGYNTMPPVLPVRPDRLTRRPSQLRMATEQRVFDANGREEETKSPCMGYVEVEIEPIDRNNDLPITSEFMSRYAHIRPPPQQQQHPTEPSTVNSNRNFIDRMPQMEGMLDDPPDR